MGAHVGVDIRVATRADVPLILAFIRELAAYERLSDEVVASESLLEKHLFPAAGPPGAEVLIGEVGGRAEGFALYFHNFSTFLARPGIYLEDLFVRPEARGHGLGAALLSRLAAVAVERGCGRLEWAVLDWNEPALGFYRRLGAQVMEQWRIHRVTGVDLEALARRGSAVTPTTDDPRGRC